MIKNARVYLETGKRSSFACALDWPGWCRRAKDDEQALEALLDYADRYRAVAGAGWAPGELEIVGRIDGDATTDFGAPSAIGDWDREALDESEAQRLTDLVESAWRVLDEVVGRAPAELRKGPRGGGRDRDAIVDHVREAERAYGRKVGVAVPPRTAWSDQRERLLVALRGGPSEGAWPVRYTIRRLAWHVTDHAWEIEDRSA